MKGGEEEVELTFLPLLFSFALCNNLQDHNAAALHALFKCLSNNDCG